MCLSLQTKCCVHMCIRGHEFVEMSLHAHTCFVWICMHGSMSAHKLYVCTSIHACLPTFTHVPCIHMCEHGHTCTMYICGSISSCAHTCTLCAHACVLICVNVFLCVCICVCMLQNSSASTTWTQSTKDHLIHSTCHLTLGNLPAPMTPGTS